LRSDGLARAATLAGRAAVDKMAATTERREHDARTRSAFRSWAFRPLPI
jgi:hypothetical protein